MTRSTDTVLAVLLVALMASWIAAYAVRCASRGPLEFQRARQQGGTVFLGLALMNAGYWLLEPLARRLAQARVPAWSLSAASLLPAAFAGAAASIGLWGAAAWGLFASSLLDVLDGAVARAAGHASSSGAILDSVLDRYAEFLLFAGFIVAFRHNVRVQLLAFAALTGSMLVTYSTAKAEALRLEPPRGLMKRSERMACLVLGLALAPISTRWVETGVGPARWHPWPLVGALALIALLSHLSAIRRFRSLARSAPP
ncbi:MAG TPA: CDP-alcohol phosphatidyltransferase family protein [Opitutaceae bacterium]|nr:CDP-alcohol phosphatidyltransferase family protein [Opitutaceae bacterium]